MKDQPSERTPSKAVWTRPTFKRTEARSAELGLGLGADLIIPGTSS